MEAEQLKERLIRELNQLPEHRLLEVLDFVEYILAKEEGELAFKQSKELDPKKDPILLKFIGGLSCGFLAENIDEELYGS